MDLHKIKGAYFLGIGGIGMSAIARYLLQQGLEIFGYDKVRTPLCKALENEGMNIHYTDESSAIPLVFTNLPEEYICICTPAVPADFGELVYLKSKGICLYKRAEILGVITRNAFTIAIAGTHGKTTTSALTAKALSGFDINFTAFLGGISTDFGSNFVSVKNKKELFDKPLMVVEADEFDRSFLQLSPDIAIVTSTDADHLDIYGQESGVREGFEAFVNGIKPNGILIQKQGLNLLHAPNIQSRNYGKENGADYQFSDTRFAANRFVFDWKNKTKKYTVLLGIPGEHNAENATAVLAVIDTLQLDTAQAAAELATFKGVKRRFEKLFEAPNHMVIDDYAHHPTELRAFISSVRKMYPQQRITGVFQPHLFSRTRDFMDDFAASLNLLDECWLMDIYPAREKPIEGVTSEALAEKIPVCKGVFMPEQILEKIKNNPPSLLLIMGAGDIDRLTQPIKKLYENLFATA